MKPKVLVVSPYGGDIGLAEFYRKAFEEIELNVERFNLMDEIPWNNIFVRYKQYAKKKVDLLNTWWRRNQNDALLKRVDEMQPDLILVIQGDDIYPETIKQIKNTQNSLIFLYYSDNPWVAGKEASCFWDTACLYDCVFTFNRCLIPHIYHIGAKKAVYLPFAYDPETHTRIEDLSNVPMIYRQHNVSYIGTWSHTYEQWLAALVPYGLAIWGNGWERAGEKIKKCWQHKEGKVLGHGTDIKYVCAVSKVIINFMRPQHMSGHSMKTFEIPASGGLMLTTRTEEQLEVFPEDICAAYFLTQAEMESKVKWFLEDEGRRKTIQRQGFDRVSSETYAVRAKAMLEVFEELKSSMGSNVL